MESWEIQITISNLSKEGYDKIMKTVTELAAQSKKEVNVTSKNLQLPDVSRQLPSVYDLDIQMLRNTVTDAEFRRKLQQWLEGNFG